MGYYGGVAIFGSNAFQNLGRNATTIGDINGDGIDDVLVTDTRSGQTDVDGNAYVVFGSATGTLPADLSSGDLDGSNGFQVVTQRELDANSFYYGFANSIVTGDFNGDGVSDIALSVQQNANDKYYDSDAETNALTYVLFGKDTSVAGVSFDSSVNLNDDTGDEGVRIIGAEGVFETMGSGDFNGDGVTDLVITTQTYGGYGGFYGEYGYGGSSNTKTAYVIFGDDSGAPGGVIDVRALDGQNGFSMDLGRTTGGYYGDGVGYFSNDGGAIFLGDVNGDGFDDLGVQVSNSTTGLYSSTEQPPNWSYTQDVNGTTYYYYYATNTVRDTYVIFGGATAADAPSNVDPAQVGTEVFWDDLSRDSFTQGGGYYTYDTIQVAAIGDVNGDGFDDVAISITNRVLTAALNPNDNPDGNSAIGMTAIVFGGPDGVDTDGAGPLDGLTSNVSLATSSGGVLINEPDVLIVNSIGFGPVFGVNVTGVGDVNGDGVDDFAVLQSGGLLPVLAVDAVETDEGGPAASTQSFGQNTGPTVFVIYGKNSAAGDTYPTILDLDALSQPEIDATGFAVTGGLPAGFEFGSRGGFGAAVSAAGDLNGDGFDDIIITDPYAGGQGIEIDSSGYAPYAPVYSGAAYVIYGGLENIEAVDNADGANDNVLDVRNLNVNPQTGELPIQVSVFNRFSTTSQAEGDSGPTTFAFTVQRTGDLTADVSFDFEVTPNGASPADASDFVGGAFPSGTASFAAGSATAIVEIEVQGDRDIESFEDFQFTISNPVTDAAAPISLGAATSNGRILNDDFPVSFRVSNASVVEGDTASDNRALTFTVSRSGEADVAASVDYTLSLTSAEAADFEPGLTFNVPIQLDFAAGETSQQVTLPIAEDLEIEANETVRITLSNATADGGVPAQISDGFGFGTIVTDDQPVLLYLNNAFVTEGDAASDNRELVFNLFRSGETGPEVEVQIEVAAPAGGGFIFPADASDFEDANVFRTYSVTIPAGSSFGELRLPIAEDVNIEAEERVEARIVGSTTPNDPTAVIDVRDSFAIGRIANDDFPPRIGVEGGGFATEGTPGQFGLPREIDFKLTRTGDTTGETSVTFVLNPLPTPGDFFAADSADISGITVNGVAVSGSGSLPQTQTVTFLDGQSEIDISVQISADGQIEPRESFELRIDSVQTFNGTNYDIFSPARTGTILNDDGRPPVIPFGVEADVFGDPHIVTLDGLGYDFQAVGEYILVETLPGAANPFQVQVRFEPLPGSDLVSTTTRMAVNIGDAMIEVDALGAETYLITDAAGTTRGLTDEEKTLGAADVDGDGVLDLFIDETTGMFTIVLNDQNEQLQGKSMNGTLNICVFLADTPTGNQGNVRGLMGDADGGAVGTRDTTDDLALRAGTVVPVGSELTDLDGNPIPEGTPLGADTPLPQPVDFDVLYGVFADGWRLDGATADKTRAFSDTAPDFPDNFPAALLTVDDLPADVRAEAEAAVRATEDPDDPLDPSVFEAAVLDFALTGNPDFITGALGLAAQEDTATEPTNAPEIPVTVSISVSPDAVAEGDTGSTPVTFTFFRLGDTSAPLAVDYAVSGDVDAADLESGTSMTGTVNFAAGADSETVVINVAGDLANELDEDLTVTITESNGALVAGASATAIIETDDFAPEAQDDVFSTTSNAVVQGNLFDDNQPLDLADNADSDADGDSFTIVSATNSGGASIGLNFNRVLPSGATLDLNSDGSFTYNPGGFINSTTIYEALRANELLSETFTYAISDGNGGTDEATVTINVLGVDDAPDARIDQYNLTEDESVSGNMITDETTGASDFDPEGGPLTLTKIGGVLLADLDEDTTTDGTQISLGTDGDLGQLTVFANGDFTYDTNGQFEELGSALPQLVSRLVSVQYTIEDDTGLEDSTALRFNVQGVNDGPVAADDSTETEFETAVNINVLGNDSDVDNALEDLEVTEASSDQGEVEIEDDGTLTFTPQEGFSGTATISYTISDPGGETSTAQVTVEVAEIANAAPVAVGDSFETSEDTAVEGNILDNDEDDGIGIVEVARVFDSTGVEIPFDTPTALPEGGLVTIGRDGSFGFDPNSDFEARGFNPQPEPPAITLSYISTDGIDDSELATISIDVTGVNDGPVANADTGSGDEGTEIVIDVLANDTDAESDPLSVFSFTDGLNGTVALNSNGDLVYTPNDPEFSGVDVFEYVATDGLANSVSASVTVTVDSVNDAPELIDIGPYEMSENTTAVGTITASDVDGDAVEFSIVGGADQALFSINSATGALIFDAAPDFEAPGDQNTDNTYEVEVQVSDGSLTDAELVSVNVLDVVEGGGVNVIQGQDIGFESLIGTAGQDEIRSGGGPYTGMLGGADADVFVFEGGNSDGQQTLAVTDYEVGIDQIDLGGRSVAFDFSFGNTTYLYLDGTDFDVLIVTGASAHSDISFG